MIVGNGVAGMEAALALRARDDEARISVVSAEHDHFFSRPALMYIFAGQTSLRDTEPYDRGLYERMRFDRVRGRVVSVDTTEKILRFADGSHLAWDRLLLAVGSKGRRAPWPGSDGPGLHYFVTLRDLEPVRRFLSGSSVLPILGDDPRGRTRQKIFSVAPIAAKSEDSTVGGYL